MIKKYCLCIHGHFYQPPRENAWTNEIETQPSAAPFHDWNERIFQECYKPNGDAVIVDGHDNVIKRINNYEFFSFDFGPSLLGWIKYKHHRTYDRIIEADKNSVLNHNGHGNAIAMVFNHVIMPLADIKDKITQVKWCLADFKFHFNRDSEGIWLPETACDNETLEVLINENIKYTILDPSQAEYVRKIHKGKWKDVSSGNIDCEIPYRFFSEKNKDRFIDIFFYNGHLSRNIAFDDHIYSSEKLLNRIKLVPLSEINPTPLISSATDGETFGHHKKYTERTLSYLFSELLPESEYRLVNFGEFLSENTPINEVKIKKGNNNEGTSWSCIHGTGRWKENCGCGRTEEYPSQEWRTPLRESLNTLRNKMRNIFESIGNNYFKDAWIARDDYIYLLLHKEDEILKNFFEKHSGKNLNDNEIFLCLKILEMQRYSMLMFTSCGWFFSDISGIETLQILQYAARAIELTKEVSDINLEIEFLDNLSLAKSNNLKYSDGRDIYIKEVKSKRILNHEN